MRSILFAASLLLAGAADAEVQKPAGVPGIAINSQQQKAALDSQDAAIDRRGTPESPFVIELVGAAKSDLEAVKPGDATPKADAKSWRDDLGTWIIAGATFLQFLALVVTIWVMIQTSRRQLRAYVNPDNAGLVDGTMLNPPQPARANEPGVVLVIKNTGDTPAYNVVSWAQIAVESIAREDQLVVPRLQSAFQSTVPQGGAISKALWYGRPLAANEIADVLAGTRAIYLYGRVEYRDTFKKRRYTNFRLKYSGRFPPIGGMIFNHCDAGNEAD